MENWWLAFDCDPDRGTFCLRSRSHPNLRIASARLCLRYRLRGSGYAGLEDGWGVFSPQLGAIQGNHGPMQTATISCGADRNGVETEIVFALPEDHPLLLWRLRLTNHAAAPIAVVDLGMLEAHQGLQLGAPDGRPAFYAQGWQSWNWTAVYGEDQPARRTRLGFLEAGMYINPSTPQPRAAGRKSADFFGILGDRASRRGWLAGFLSQKEQFGSVEACLAGALGLRLWASGDGALVEPGQQMVTDWAALQPVNLDEDDPLAAYVEAVARENAVRPLEAGPLPPAGWCSWYHFYGAVTASQVRANLEALQAAGRQLPLDLVQIDDGFETRVGDWYSFRPGFPQGVAPLAAEIKAAGKLPGLWLAPFIVDPRSDLAKNHPEYLLRGQNGRPVRAGFNWGVITTALDLTVPEALEYAAGVVRTASTGWGFPYLKLDFLYAGGLKGAFRDPHKTRAQVLRQGLEALREAAGPDTFLLGCGVPVGPAVGLFDGMRIGADTAGDWLPSYLGIYPFFQAEPHMPALRNAVQNPLTRAMLHRRWWFNDPDCLLVRPETKLSLAEVQTQATVIGMTGGMLLLSDDLPALPAERLRIAASLLPQTGKRPVVLDWFDRETPARLRLDLDGPAGSWHVLALFNWEDRPQSLDVNPADFRLPPGAYWLCSFWDGRVCRLEEAGVARFDQVPAHGALLLAARPVSGAAQYLGSDLHALQGLELAGWQETASGVRLNLLLPRAAHGCIYLWLPRPPQTGFSGKQTIHPADLGGGVWQIPVQVEGETDLWITY